MNKYAFWISLSTVMTMACGSSSTSVGLELDASSHDTQSDVRDTSLEAWSEPDAKVETDTSSHDSWVPETLQEASSDTQGADTGADTEKSCATGQKECRGYKLYQCVAQNTWEYQMGSQDCCTTNGRFVVVGTVSSWIVKDNQTGFLWVGGDSSPYFLERACDYGFSNVPKLDAGTWRVPTLSELQTLVVGKADLIDGKYYSVCDPTLDHHVWSGHPGSVGVMGTSTSASSGKFWGIHFATGYPVEIDPKVVTTTICVH